VQWLLFAQCAMAPALAASIIPLLPAISHFAFDFEPPPLDFTFEPHTVDVPPLTSSFGALLNTQWFEDAPNLVTHKQKLRFFSSR
jgi:hypothetical protein